MRVSSEPAASTNSVNASVISSYVASGEMPSVRYHLLSPPGLAAALLSTRRARGAAATATRSRGATGAALRRVASSAGRPPEKALAPSSQPRQQASTRSA